MEQIKQILQQGIQQLNLTAEQIKLDKQLKYIALLEKWNKAFNLTAIKNPKEMVVLHTLDSLAVHPYIKGPKVLDVGTGPGIPGIPLALCFPDIQFTLLDSNGKKTRFIQQAVIELGIKNVTIENCRIEKLANVDGFEQIISRAFTATQDFVDLVNPYLAPQGEMLAMKGLVPEDELKQIDPDIFTAEVITLNVPKLEAQRHIVRIKVRKH